MENQAAWKTKGGFDNLNKRQNFNEHPKKPPMSKAEELMIPYHIQMNESLSKLQKKIYRPEEEGKPDFVKRVPGIETFSKKDFFKTVFAGGDDVENERLALL